MLLQAKACEYASFATDIHTCTLDVYMCACMYIRVQIHKRTVQKKKKIIKFTIKRALNIVFLLIFF